jgi:hypothetical protein
MWDAFSGERTDLSFTIAAGPLQRKVFLFISPRNRVLQLYLQALGSLLVAFYDPKGYGGGIRTLFHKVVVNFKVGLRVPLRLAVYHQSVCLGVKPLEDHNQGSFCNWTLIAIVLMLQRQLIHLNGRKIDHRQVYLVTFPDDFRYVISERTA